MEHPINLAYLVNFNFAQHKKRVDTKYLVHIPVADPRTIRLIVQLQKIDVYVTTKKKNKIICTILKI